MKKLLSIALSLCLLLSVALADVTLTKVYTTEDLVSNTFHNGFGGNLPENPLSIAAFMI